MWPWLQITAHLLKESVGRSSPGNGQQSALFRARGAGLWEQERTTHVEPNIVASLHAAAVDSVAAEDRLRDPKHAVLHHEHHRERRLWPTHAPVNLQACQTSQPDSLMLHRHTSAAPHRCLPRSPPQRPEGPLFRPVLQGHLLESTLRTCTMYNNSKGACKYCTFPGHPRGGQRIRQQRTPQRG
jgi:hypothetical protein